MTYQKPTPNYDNTDADADESSSLFLTVADASPSSSLGQGRVATKKNGVLMVAVVATCFLLGTIYSPYLQKKKYLGSSSILLGQDQEAVYTPGRDYCFKATHVDFAQFCWYATNSMPYGDWAEFSGAGNNNCGPLCTSFEASNAVTYYA